MAKPSVEIKCPHCSGKGSVPLPEELATTLAMFGRKSSFTAAAAHEKHGGEMTVNSMNNRLERLRKLGKLDREKVSRHWHYRLPQA